MTAAPAIAVSAALSDRSDFAVIGRLVAPGSRVLDLGCGEGELLAWLKQHKGVTARGVEISPAQVRRAIARGVSAFQGDLNEGLADFPDGVFDYVILSQTLQEIRDPVRVIHDMLRVGKHAIVSFPNFGHWHVRATMLIHGRSPRTRAFPYEWYETPNIHFLSVNDFEALAVQEKFRVEHREFLTGERRIGLLPNLRAETAVFLLTRSDTPNHSEKPVYST